MTAENSANPTALLIGASRGLGLAMAAELIQHGWNVVGTVRGSTRTELHDLAERFAGRVEVEHLDINDGAQRMALRDRLKSRRFEILFVIAGIANKDPNEVIGEVSTDEFTQVMVTNALSPMRVMEMLQDIVTANGLIGAMSSGQGSIANNAQGGRDLYRGSKAALNMFMRSFAARQENSRSLLVMAPGWIKTDLGGPDATFTIEESAPKLVDVLLDKLKRPGLEYLDRNGQTVPW